ncbi:glycerol-3-phosphate 1-O-acyltransferase PlsY [Aquisphaera insulae]|uniref:glycerol-3-phosphate 1-O-acyltransferase PlsY n=1 Tax=Aquisphaera insulae TaxID=2712864 RepID=UPI00202E51D8|nr:glycerol-3-phosphate 1-O-acyltransferase PlsY [Aquisphaera insulae]
MIGIDNPWIQDMLGGLVGYAVGGIPFGFLIFKAVRGVDIRTVGSGNIGATNVGRMLGFRFFLLVFVLDLLKGLLPTLGLPWAIGRAGVAPSPDLAVFTGLGAILGHNFPAYLGFRGGKGVATSLGALLALDPVASGAAAVAWFAVFGATRIVSASSIAGAIGFVAAYFVRTSEPWSREHLAMSVFSIAIAVLLIGRHRKNLGRLRDGTEPRVSFRKGREEGEAKDKGPSAGRVSLGILAGLAVVASLALGAGAWLAGRASESVSLVTTPLTLREVARELTGQQRTTRIQLAEGGKSLVVMCPRYNKTLVYGVDESLRMERLAVIDLDGRPVAIAAGVESVRILQRPPGDDKHLGPGWLECFRLDGTKVGTRIEAGYYPDDMAITPDGRFALVLSSGRAEGDAKKPLPCLEIYGIDPATTVGTGQKPIGRLELDPSDDPDRLHLSANGSRLLIRLAHSDTGLAVDLSNPANPRLVGRTPLNATAGPYLSRSPDGDSMIMPAGSDSEAVAFDDPDPSRRDVARTAMSTDAGESLSRPLFLVATRPEDSCLEISLDQGQRRSLGRFPMMGPLNLGGTRPTGLSYSPERGLLAVATKPGTIHLIEVRPRADVDRLTPGDPRR